MTQTQKPKKLSLQSILAVVVAVVLFLLGQQFDLFSGPEQATGPITEPQAIVNYLAAHNGELPDNFLTKAEAQALGWDSSKNYLSDVAPGKSIGGDRFGNYEGLLPAASGRQYHEADCYYAEGPRNAYRLVYSTDGLYFYTEDHYESFTEMFPEE